MYLRIARAVNWTLTFEWHNDTFSAVKLTFLAPLPLYELGQMR